ncbi:MAG: hypothetical protein V3W22_07295 [Thermoplasmata archaeon]
MNKLEEAFKAWVHPLWNLDTLGDAFIAFEAGYQAGLIDREAEE